MEICSPPALEKTAPLNLEAGDVKNSQMDAIYWSPNIQDGHNLQPLDAHDDALMDEECQVDWSILANVLESDFRSKADYNETDIGDTQSASTGDTQFASADTENLEPYTKKKRVFNQQEELQYRTLTPRALVTRTCRSELVASLLSSHGDVTNPRFLKALDVISSIYASCDPGKPTDYTSDIDNYLNSAWVSLSRPAYDGCLGKNHRGDYMYTLGKMSFNMFKPGHLQCSIQHTLNKIEYVCDINQARNAVPWSLRRELAFIEDKDLNDDWKSKKTLRSYE